MHTSISFYLSDFCPVLLHFVFSSSEGPSDQELKDHGMRTCRCTIVVLSFSMTRFKCELRTSRLDRRAFRRRKIVGEDTKPNKSETIATIFSFFLV